MATPCRGDCEAGGMIQLVFYCRVRRLAVNPSVGVRRQLPLHKGGPVAGRPYCFCRIAPNQPPLWRWARIAKRPLPGDGLSHPEHRGIEEHKAFSEFWDQRHALSIPQSAFADSSLCTREPSLLPSIQPASVFIVGCGSTAWVQRHAANPSVGVRRSGVRTAILSLPWLVVLAWAKRV